MAQEVKHIYRSANGVFGGVCAGVAQRFDLDDTLVRLLVMVLSVLTVGVFLLVYLAAWMVLPVCSDCGRTVEVDPESFRSEVYEQVVNRSAPSSTAKRPAAAHISPAPPAAASGYYATHPARAAFGSQAAPLQVQAPDSRSWPHKTIPAVLVAGVLLIVLGAALIFSGVSGSFTAVQFWPLAIVAAGVVRIVVPARDGTRMVTSWAGGLLAFSGLALLASSLGLYTVDTDVWLTRAAPFLVVALGLFLMGRSVHSDVLLVCAAIALALFLCVGVFLGFRDTAAVRNVSLPFNPEAVLSWDGD